MMKKRLVSIFLAIFMIVEATPFAMAVETEKSLDYKLLMTEELLHGEVITVEQLGETLLYTYKTDAMIYCSQVEPDGTMAFSYIKEEADYIYASDVFNISNIPSPQICNFNATDNLEGLKNLNNFVMNNMGFVQISPAIDLCLPAPFAAKPDPDPDHRAESTWGPDGIVDTWEKEQNGYTMNCTERQVSFKLDHAAFRFAEKTAVNEIKTWFTNLKKAPKKFDWFLGALQVSVSVINGVKSITEATKGTISYYECDRIKDATVPSVTSDVVYSSYRIIKKFFMFANDVWSQDDDYDEARQDYYNIDTFFTTAFTRFFANYL